MPEIPDWAEDLFDETEKENARQGNGFDEVTVVEVTENSRSEHRALCEYLDSRNPGVVNPMDGVRIYPYDEEGEYFAFESEEDFEESQQIVGWFVKEVK